MRRHELTDVLVDALGNPLHLHLTAGNVNDVSEAPRLVEAARGTYFIADKGYDYYRRAATRFDKTAANFLRFVLLAAIRISLA